MAEKKRLIGSELVDCGDRLGGLIEIRPHRRDSGREKVAELVDNNLKGWSFRYELRCDGPGKVSNEAKKSSLVGLAVFNLGLN